MNRDLQGKREYSLPEYVIYQKIQNEVVILNMKTQEYFSLDPVGSNMWIALAEKGNTEDASDSVCVLYEADEQTIRSDLAELALRLEGVGLLQCN